MAAIRRAGRDDVDDMLSDGDSEHDDELMMEPKKTFKQLIVGAQDRRFDDMQLAIRGIKNAQKISDWSTISNELDKLVKTCNKHGLVMEREGVPNFLIRILVELDDYLRDVQQNTVAKRKLSATNAKAMNTVKPKLKKFAKTYEAAMVEYRLDPSLFVDTDTDNMATTAASAKTAASALRGQTKGVDSKKDSRSARISSDEESDDTSDEETSDEEDSDADDRQGAFVTATSKKPVVSAKLGVTATAAKVPTSKFMQMNIHNDENEEDQLGSLSEESDWSVNEDDLDNEDRDEFGAGLSSEESDAYSSDESDNEAAGPRKKGLAKWGLRTTATTTATGVTSGKLATKAAITGAAAAAAKRKPVRVVDSDEEDNIARLSAARAATESAAKALELTPENIVKKVREIADSRGKKGIDRAEQLGVLRKLLEMARGSLAKTVHVLIALIPLQFDYYSPLSAATAATTTSVLPREAWKNIERDVNDLLSFLSNPEARTFFIDPAELDEEIKESDAKAALPRILHGTIVSFIERLDDEWTKSLQLMDPHAVEYVDRLRDERTLYGTVVKGQNLFESVGHSPSVWRCIMRRAEHLYAKHDSMIARLCNDSRQGSDVSNGSKLLQELCRVLYVNADERTRARALLFEVYHHALHDRYHRARDIYLMSRLQETVQSQDASTQILFNRTMVHLGLCAFRSGLLRETAYCLQDIALNTKFRELLGQGITMLPRFMERTVEQEKQDKLRQLPYHMHIAMELIETTYLISAMLVEIPTLAQHAFDRSRIQSRPFKRLMDYFERQIFVGPPETNRDQLMAAARALTDSDWKKCNEILCSLKIWPMISPVAEIVERVRNMICKRVQEEALRTFVFAHSSNYISLSLGQLSDLFALPVNTVQAAVLSMILNEELAGSLDQPSGTLVLHKMEQSRMQQLALQFADKAAMLVDSNERWIEVHSGVIDPQQHPQQQQQHDGMQDMNAYAMRGGRRSRMSQMQMYGSQRGRGGPRNYGMYHAQQQRQQPMTVAWQ